MQPSGKLLGTILILIFWTLIAPEAAGAGSPQDGTKDEAVSVTLLRRAALSPGEAAIVEVDAGDDVASVTGTALDRPLLFWKEDDHRFRSLIGLDRDVAPGTHPLHLALNEDGGSRRDIEREIEVGTKDFRVVSLRVPAKRGGFTKQDLARIREEKAIVDSVLSRVSAVRLWRTSFGPPLDRLTVTDDFGTGRVINGVQRSSHGGLDLRAAAGTPVKASNEGIVALVGDHYYTGNCVYLDHGLGVYSMYFHLSKVLVRTGDRVAKGQVIGEVGSTGRSTGPHLHWAFTINRARIDPLSLLCLPID